MLFSELPGHNKIKDILLHTAANNRIGHAYLFEGPSGVGKINFAKAFAQRLLCENPIHAEACGKCPSCSRCESGNHPDLSIVTNQLYDPTKKSTDILVETIRKMKSDVYVKPFLSTRKIYIIPKADTMNLYSQNSLLKVLEEPPGYCTIILLAENSNSFLPTIRSRVSEIKFYPLSEEEVECELSKIFHSADAEKIKLASKMSGGSLTMAKQFVEDEDKNLLRDELLNAVFALWEGRRKAIYDFSLLLKKNKDQIEFLMSIMRDLFRDILYIKQTNDSKGIINLDRRIKIEKLAENTTQKTSLRLIEIFLKYSDYFSKNIGYGSISQCIGLELWEAINDRGYRSKI